MGIPKKVEARLLARGAREGAVVVVFRKGRPVRIFGFDEYVGMKDLPKKVKPWTRRKARPAPDPLGAIRGGRVLRPLRRSEFYD
jgi:hypothetical protein